MGTSFFRCLIVLSSLVGFSFLTGHAYAKGDQCAAVKSQVDCGKKAGCAWGGKTCAAKKVAAAPAKKSAAAPAKKSVAPAKAKSKPVAGKKAAPAKKTAPVAKKVEPKKPAMEEPAMEEPAEDSMGDMPADDESEG